MQCIHELHDLIAHNLQLGPVADILLPAFVRLRDRPVELVQRRPALACVRFSSPQRVAQSACDAALSTTRTAQKRSDAARKGVATARWGMPEFSWWIEPARRRISAAQSSVDSAPWGAVAAPRAFASIW